MEHCKDGDRTTAHAAAHQMRPFDFQMLEESAAVRDIMCPGDALNASTRLAALAAIEHDAGVMLRQMVQQLDPRILKTLAAVIANGNPAHQIQQVGLAVRFV